jgi:O-antigen/teichoic acid export membrane protein
MAILKGTRQLKSLAVIMLYNVLTALVISVPVYYFFNQKGIVPVMLMMGAVAMFLTLQRSYAMFPLRLKGFKCIRYEGLDMIRLGVAFTLAGILGSGAEFAIRSYLNYFADLDVVGLYNAGFVMTMTYGGLIFSAMETDYFPRLSAANNDVVKYNDLINKQAEVSLLLIAPLLVAALFWLPVALPLLTSVKFLPVVDMMRFMALSLYFRAVNLPIEYLSLARGASLSYLFLESVYDILMVALVIVGYHVWGLTGTGFAILATTLCNTALVLIYMGIRFHVRLRWALVRMQIVQVAIGLLAFCCCLQLDGWEYWLSGVALFLLSLFVSVHLLQQKSHLWEKLKLKFIGRFR